MGQFLLQTIASASQGKTEIPASKTDAFDAALNNLAKEKGDDVVIHLLYAIREFTSTGDRAALLQLPLEERQLVEPWLRSSEQKDRSAKK
jgi:hypothetical protein